MKTRSSQCRSTTALGLLLALTGCVTAGKPNSESTSRATVEGDTPFLSREDYGERLGGTVTEVLRAHQFSRPFLVVKGADNSIWFVDDRIHSEHSFERLFVRIGQNETVSASISGCQFGPSDWATLGRGFVDFTPEAKLIAAEIGNRLQDSKK